MHHASYFESKSKLPDPFIEVDIELRCDARFMSNLNLDLDGLGSAPIRAPSLIWHTNIPRCNVNWRSSKYFFHLIH